MLNVNNQVLLDDAYTVLVKLKEDVLLQTGKEYFKNFIIKNDNIQFCCPVHKGGQEQKPSCGMTTNTKQKSDGTFITAGTVHCFTKDLTDVTTPLYEKYCMRNDWKIYDEVNELQLTEYQESINKKEIN